MEKGAYDRSLGERTRSSYPRTAGVILDTLAEVLEEHLVLWIRYRIRPVRPDSSHQPCDPVGSLNCLIAMAFYLERRLNEPTSWLGAPKHALPCCGDDG